MELNEIIEKLKMFPSSQSRADAVHKCIERGILSLEDLKRIQLRETILKGIDFSKETMFREDPSYHEIIATDSYSLPGGRTVLAVDVNEWGEKVGYKELGNKGTARSLETTDEYTKTTESGPIQSASKESVGRYRKEVVENDKGSRIRNVYDYNVDGENLQIEEQIVEQEGNKEYIKMVNGVPAFAVQMQGNDVVLVQYTREGQPLTTYTYDSRTGLPKDYDPNIQGHRKFPGIDRLQIDDPEYAFEDIIGTQTLQNRGLSPEERQVIEQSEQVPFTPNRNLDRLKESLGMETSQTKKKENEYEY